MRSEKGILLDALLRLSRKQVYPPYLPVFSYPTRHNRPDPRRRHGQRHDRCHADGDGTAAFHTAALRNRPAEAVQLAELALRPELELANPVLAERIGGATTAREIMDRLLAITALEGAPPDDLTVMVIHCRVDICQS